MTFRSTTFLITALFLGACNPYYYVPNAQNVPMISERNELTLSVTTDEDQINFQGAFGLKDNLAIQANYFHYSNGKSKTGVGNYYEIGAGYFNSNIEHLNFECYGLLGIGNLTARFNSSDAFGKITGGQLNAQVIRYGLQPVIAHKSRYFAIAFSSRLSILNYDGISGNLIISDVSQVDYLNNRKTHFLVEPALTVRAGFKNIKAQAQYVYSTNMSHPNFYQLDEILTIGLFLDLPAKNIFRSN